MKKYYMLFDDLSELDTAISDLNGYWKFLSILHLRKILVPTLSGIIITTWDHEVKKVIEKLCQKRNWSSLLLRHDKKPESPPYPMGGYLVRINDLESEVNKFLALGRILFFLEPYSSFNNSYNINFMFEQGFIKLEILGPGFDASDLQRGYITPHETMMINQDQLKENLSSYSLIRAIVKKNVCTVEQYKRSVTLRFLKIAQRLKDFNEISVSPTLQEVELIAIVQDYLVKKGYDNLILVKENYTPISRSMLIEAIGHILFLPEKLKIYNYRLPFVVAASFVDKGDRLVFWDIVQPKLKYNL